MMTREEIIEALIAPEKVSSGVSVDMLDEYTKSMMSQFKDWQFLKMKDSNVFWWKPEDYMPIYNPDTVQPETVSYKTYSYANPMYRDDLKITNYDFTS